jgi:hypothetical protein
MFASVMSKAKMMKMLQPAFSGWEDGRIPRRTHGLGQSPRQSAIAPSLPSARTNSGER